MNHFDSEYLFKQSMTEYLNTRDFKKPLPPLDETTLTEDTYHGDFERQHLKDVRELITDINQEVKVYFDKKVKVATWGPWILKLQDASIDFHNQRLDFLLHTAMVTKQPIKYHGLTQEDLLKAKNMVVMIPYEPDMAFITRIHDLLQVVPPINIIDQFQGVQLFLNLSTIDKLDQYFDLHTYQQMVRSVLALKKIKRYQTRAQKLKQNLNIYQAAPYLHFPSKMDTCSKCVVCSTKNQVKKSKYTCSGCVKITGKPFALCLDNCFAQFHIHPDKYLDNL